MDEEVEHVQYVLKLLASRNIYTLLYWLEPSQLVYLTIFQSCNPWRLWIFKYIRVFGNISTRKDPTKYTRQHWSAFELEQSDLWIASSFQWCDFLFWKIRLRKAITLSELYWLVEMWSGLDTIRTEHWLFAAILPSDIYSLYSQISFTLNLSIYKKIRSWSWELGLKRKWALVSSIGKYKSISRWKYSTK